MVVYIEYALAWNFLIDAALLSLSQRACRAKIKWGKTLFSSAIGAIFAVIFPLLNVGDFWGNFSKFAVGFLLCFLVSNGIKTKKQRGRYALICLYFFCFCFIVGGTLSALAFSYATPRVAVLIAIGILLLICALIIEKAKQRRAVTSRLYDCAIAYKQRETSVLGFYDSGNLAEKNGVPVCFLSAEIFYDIFMANNGAEESERTGQVWDEMQITTLAGEKKVKIVKGELKIKTKEQVYHIEQVYFSPTANMVTKEYELLLHTKIFEEKGR